MNEDSESDVKCTQSMENRQKQYNREDSLHSHEDQIVLRSQSLEDSQEKNDLPDIQIELSNIAQNGRPLVTEMNDMHKKQENDDVQKQFSTVVQQSQVP